MSGTIRLKGSISGHIDIHAPSTGPSASMDLGLLVKKDSANGSVQGVTSDAVVEGSNHHFYSTSRFDSDLSASSTSALSEGTNLYYTSVRFDSDLSVTSTSSLAEGTNLYYTSTRFDSDLSASSTSSLAEGTNLYYTSTRFDSDLSTSSTSVLPEGTNLYYTSARVDSDFSAGISSISTDSVAEGGANLYHTSSRVKEVFPSIADSASSGVVVSARLHTTSLSETKVTLSGTSPNIDVANGSVFTLSTSGSTTFTFATPPTSGDAYGFTLIMTSGSSGYTHTWPSSVDWPGSSAPDNTIPSGNVNIYGFFTYNNGSTWYGFLSGEDMG
jgi:hypothetical protein